MARRASLELWKLFRGAVVPQCEAVLPHKGSTGSFAAVIP